MGRAKVMLIVFIGLAFFLVLLAGWWMYRWQYDTAERVLREWAEQQQLTVLERDLANTPYSGPANRYASNKQVIYRIKVRDHSGRVRQGVAKIGTEKCGTLQPQIEVKLDP